MATQTVNTVPQVRSESERAPRPSRIPFGVPRSKLEVPLDVPGYHLHWINDEEGRLAEAQRGAYTFVKPSEIGDTASEESQVKRLVGTTSQGTPLYAYLMKLEDEFYEEDQKALTSVADEFDRAIRRGEIDKRPGDNRYSRDIKIS